MHGTFGMAFEEEEGHREEGLRRTGVSSIQPTTSSL
jgi:hypothetical protein